MCVYDIDAPYLQTNSAVTEKKRLTRPTRAKKNNTGVETHVETMNTNEKYQSIHQKYNHRATYALNTHTHRHISACARFCVCAKQRTYTHFTSAHTFAIVRLFRIFRFQLRFNSFVIRSFPVPVRARRFFVLASTYKFLFAGFFFVCRAHTCQTAGTGLLDQIGEQEEADSVKVSEQIV